VLAVVLSAASGASAQSPALLPSVAVDGPSSALSSLSGLSISRDGTGGIVYAKSVSGVSHVFVSRLVGGAFLAPEQVDASLGGASSQPVIAAGDNGLLLIAFINGGQLYAVTRPNASAGYGAPVLLAAGASNPAIALSIHDKGYLAFTAVGAAGHNVRAAYWVNGTWALESSPLDAAPGNDAGTGTGAPRVVAAGDGVGIVVWGEAGHIYTRRVWGISPSVVYEQADPPSLSGWNEVSAGAPSIATDDDSSYADVAFQEVFTNGSAKQSRVVMRKLRASQYDQISPLAPDGLTTPGAEGAVQPQVALSEAYQGFLTSARDASNNVWVSRLGPAGLPQTVTQLNSLFDASPPYAVPATTGQYLGLVAWQHDPGTGGAPDIRARYFDGTNWGPELLASSPGLGPTDAAAGLFAGGDSSGDVAAAWVQGASGSASIVTALLYAEPGSVAAVTGSRYSRTTRPVFSWSPAHEQWGPVRYTVSVDGTAVLQTTRTAVRAPTLSQGPHVWLLTATNQAGLTSQTRAVSVFVDSYRPAVQLRLTGSERAKSALRLSLRYSDQPPGLPLADGSGIALVTVSWGDGNSATIHHGALHTYARPGRYRLTVTVTDRAGNRTTLSRVLGIAAGK
jgi:hypothetical protein